MASIEARRTGDRLAVKTPASASCGDATAAAPMAVASNGGALASTSSESDFSGSNLALIGECCLG